MSSAVLRWFAGAAVVLASLAPCTSLATEVNRAPGRGNLDNLAVFPTVSRPYGHSYSEWSAIWWQWAYGLPADNHPLFDETGAAAATGQSGQVWFLGGVFNVSGSATRNVTIPSGTALFFPIINVEWDNLCPPLDPPLDLAGLQAAAKAAIDGASDLQCDLDGVSFQHVDSYRFTSVMAITFPANNLFDLFGCPTPPGTYSPLASDGFWIMLKPLSVGTHDLHFHGRIAAFNNFTLDITYHLTVSPDVVTMTQQASTTSNSNTAPPTAPARRATWGQLKILYR